jgi:hypothetical protein
VTQLAMVIMVVSILSVTSLITWCFYRVLTSEAPSD